MKKKLVVLISSAFLLVGCGSKNKTGDTIFHEHSFSENWSTDETYHWRIATCGHNELTKDFGEHIDKNSDHKCDVCEKVLSECYDKNSDHKCDYCGKTISNHVDENNDHYCDVCEVKFSECVDTNSDNHCDICDETIDITIEPVTKEYYLKGIEALKGNYSATVEDEYIYDFYGTINDYFSKSTVEHDKNNVTHAKELEKHLKRTIDLETLKDNYDDIFGKTPNEEEIQVYVNDELFDEDFAVGFYYQFTDLDKIIHEDGSSVYSVEAKQIESIGARFDAIKGGSRYEEYRRFDYVDIYLKNYLNTFADVITLGKKEHYREFNLDNDQNLIDLVYHASKKLDLATYVAEEKTYIFEGQTLGELLDPNEYDFKFPGSFFIGNPYSDFKEGQLIIDFTSENEIDSISLDAKFVDNIEIKLNADITIGGDDIVLPECAHIECEHPEHYVEMEAYDDGHCLHCNLCDSIISCSEHTYDEEGVCVDCGHECVEYKTIHGEDFVGYPKELYVEINPYTEKINGIYAPYDESYVYVEKTKLGDLAKFENVDDTVYAPRNYESLQTFYVLDIYDEYVDNGCYSGYVERSAVYKIDNGVASLFLGPIFDIGGSERHSIDVNPEDLEKVGNRLLIGTCYCKDCGKEFDCVCEASVSVWESSNYVDKTKVHLSITYKDEHNEIQHCSVEVDPIYDENGFDFYTGYHTYVDAYYIDSYLVGYFFYDHSGSIAYNGEVLQNYDHSFDGATEVYTLKGTPEEVTIQVRIDYDVFKDPNTCLLTFHEMITIVYNDEIYDVLDAYTNEGIPSTMFNHTREYVEGSYRFDELLNMYVCEFYCPDCGQTITLYEVVINTDDLNDKHTFTGYYFEEMYGEFIEVSVTLEANCVPNPDNAGHCLICGQEIL